MIARLPRWAVVGGVLIAFTAGMINVTGFLGLHHQAISHMTGTVSLFGMAIARANADAIFYQGGLLLAFVVGCLLSGFITGNESLELGRRYGVALGLEALLLIGAVPLLHMGVAPGLWLAAAACGLQNAMAASYSGAVVRTSHMTGMITDLGMFAGQWLRGSRVDRRRVGLYLILLGAFFMGGVVGTVTYARWQEYTLLVPAGFAGMTALGYVLMRRRT